MIRGQQKKKPVIVESSLFTQTKTLIPEKNELIKLLSSYIKGQAKRDETYTSLMKLKTSISQ
jgi:hypothetical protein